jgi:hypothetical protein
LSKALGCLRAHKGGPLLQRSRKVSECLTFDRPTSLLPSRFVLHAIRHSRILSNSERGTSPKTTSALVHKRLDAIKSEDVQHLKGRLSMKAAKTVNNILTVLNVLLKKAVDWDVIDRMPCAVTLLSVPKTSMSFYDFDEYERLVVGQRARRDCAPHRASGWGGGPSVWRDDRA